MLYYAIFVPADAQPPPRDIVDAPQLVPYVRGFGTQDGTVSIISPFAYFRNEFIKFPHERVKNGHLGSISPHMVIKIAEMFYTLRNRVHQRGKSVPNFAGFSGSSGVKIPFSAQKNKRTVRLWRMYRKLRRLLLPAIIAGCQVTVAFE
jgi:hypothetical protein